MSQNEYLERVYAGVLGKIIGVYLGRPFEGWTYQKIMATLGEITYYVNEKMNIPLVVTDDDISGTFTFLRALEDKNYVSEFISEDIGWTWLNYLIENRTVLWWGGMGNSTEHTAYLRLKNGVRAPLSGSASVNGKVVSEQIGAQIFIDGWALICPGDPEEAVRLAKLAASVSHDGEAVYGAQVLAAMESLAFIESDRLKLVETARRFIPQDSIIYRMIGDILEWHQIQPDWRKTRQLIEAHYGYDRYGGNCHIIPNHALIQLGFLYGNDDFQESLMITNTAGWDTDCNSGNLGCLMGIKNGLSGIDGDVDWRGPVADRMLIPTADGGRVITDAVTETLKVFNMRRKLINEPPLRLKGGSRFHFELPGSVQGFQVGGDLNASIANVSGYSNTGNRSLKLNYTNLTEKSNLSIYTPTFIQKDELSMQGYGLMGSPSLYPGQTIKAALLSDPAYPVNIQCRLFISVFGKDDNYEYYYGPSNLMVPGEWVNLEWKINLIYQLIGKPIAQVGIEFSSDTHISGNIILDYMDWKGTPAAIMKKPKFAGSAWRASWVNAVDYFYSNEESFRLINNSGRGFLIHGTQEWTDYQVNADIVPHMVKSTGLAVRFQGLNRYYAFLLCKDGKARLIKVNRDETVLAEQNQGWRLGEGTNLSIEVSGNRIKVYWDGFLVLDYTDQTEPLLSGGIALVVDEGRTATEEVSIYPISDQVSALEHE